MEKCNQLVNVFNCWVLIVELPSYLCNNENNSIIIINLTISNRNSVQSTAIHFVKFQHLAGWQIIDAHSWNAKPQRTFGAWIFILDQNEVNYKILVINYNFFFILYILTFSESLFSGVEWGSHVWRPILISAIHGLIKLAATSSILI